ncbi:MAG: ATP-binding protein [Patescibacteria group bacterium]|nr:ATP-binding protein [Patescibacteria group bacterium]
MAFFDIFTNYDLLSVGIAIAASTLLGFIVFFSNPKSYTSKFFLMFTLVSSAWGGVNYLVYQFSKPEVSLIFIRLVMFMATWQAFSFFLLTFVFPKEECEIPKKFKYLLLPLTILVSLLALTPLVYKNINTAASAGEVAQATPGPGIIAFGLLAIGLVLSGIINLIRRAGRSDKADEIKYRFFLLGVGSMFILIITLNFILPNIFSNYNFIPFGALYIFPFAAFTSYSILRHHLLNIKIVATEILVFFLIILNFLEVLLSKSQSEVLFRLIVLIALLIFSVLLIRSVLKEIEQREQLQILTGKLETANEKLKALDQARAEFISIASHQLRTPPATIKWYLAAILSGDYGPLDPEVKTALQKTEQTNNLLISLIEDILNVSRIERGKMEFLFEPVDLENLAEITYEQLKPIALEKKLDLTFKKPTVKLPQVLADKEKIRQVMNNLIDNALKYTKQGSVAAEICRDNDDIKFKVTDTGKGISEQDRKSIFDKYKRGKESIHQSAGLGLGLYVAKVVMDQHHGKIWAESAGEGKGSSFIFSIPMHNSLKATTLLDLTEQTQKAAVP